MVQNFSKLICKFAVLVALLALGACQGGIDGIFPKAEKPVPSRLLRKIKEKGMNISSPILLRIYKTENKLEVWKAKKNGRYAFLKDYEICQWSGKLGPKFKEGDRQAPEGFYDVGPAQMNPNSSYHLSFNMGYPNRYDRSHGRTGKHLMVHGACSSAGCYSMTDEYVEEIYSLAREAFKGGQKAMQVQAYPFKMTPKNLAEHVNSPHFEFWKMLKRGSDYFEVTQLPPKVNVCEKRYVFNQVSEGGKFQSRLKCPAMNAPITMALAYNKKQTSDQSSFVTILSQKASSPFVEATVRSAAKKQVPIEKAVKSQLQQQRVALAVRQQEELQASQKTRAEKAAAAQGEQAKDIQVTTRPAGDLRPVEPPAPIGDGSTPADETKIETPGIQFAKPVKKPWGPSLFTTKP